MKPTSLFLTSQPFLNTLLPFFVTPLSSSMSFGPFGGPWLWSKETEIGGELGTVANTTDVATAVTGQRKGYGGLPRLPAASWPGNDTETDSHPGARCSFLPSWSLHPSSPQSVPSFPQPPLTLSHIPSLPLPSFQGLSLLGRPKLPPLAQPPIAQP